MKSLPFSLAISPGTPAPALPGYITRIYGLYLTSDPWASATGPASLGIAGTANIAAGASMVFVFMPSATDPINVPVDFGVSGIQSAGTGPANPITFTINTSGSDNGSGCEINIWGVLEDADS